MGGATKSDSSSQQESKVWGEQSPFLTALYQAGADQAQGFQPNQEIAQGAMSLFNQGIGAGTGPNPHLDAMTNRFRNELGYANQAAGGQAGLAGAYGGGRHGVANALNAQQYQSNVGNFLGNQYQQDQNRFAGERQNTLGQARNVLNLQEYGQQQGALQDYAGLLGAPTVLGSGSSGSSSMGFNIGK